MFDFIWFVQTFVKMLKTMRCHSSSTAHLIVRDIISN